MCRLLETIKLLDGNLQNIEYHNRRLNASINECYGIESNVDVFDIIQIPQEFKTGLYRCRLTYDNKNCHIEYIPYKFRTIKTLKLVYDDQIDYHLKYADRSRLDFLFSQRGDCDDIIIVKNGCLTDSYATNLVFFDGNEWVTPITPLLPGTMRMKLLKQGTIKEIRIPVSDLYSFISVGLINAFHSFDNMPVVSVANIKF